MHEYEITTALLACVYFSGNGKHAAGSLNSSRDTRSAIVSRDLQQHLPPDIHTHTMYPHVQTLGLVEQ